MIEPGVPTRTAGVATLVFALALPVWFVLARIWGPEDGDNAAQGLAFLRDHPRAFAASGLASIVMGIALVVAVLAISDLVRNRGLVARVATTLGLFAAAFFVFNGVLRLGAPGTVGYIEAMDTSWGEAAYLAIHMTSTQGAALAGIVCVSMWALALTRAGRRGGLVPRWLDVIAVFPGVLVASLLAQPLGVDDLPDGVYVLYLASFLGLGVWFLAFAVVLLRRSPAS